MIRPRYVALWWIPLLLVLAPVAGLAPAPRDIVDFFAPIRSMTASSLASGVIPWLNPANGCGEAWFANPETAVLYPPAWIHLILPPAWAITLEIALHLAWLALGAGLLARALGAGSMGRMVAEAATSAAGPVVFTIGVLNNLETLAWIPWMVLAARGNRRWSTALVALTTALAWLGGEPQIWALGVVAALVAGRLTPRVVAGCALGVLVVAVQMVPFVIWVLEGDRGPQAAGWLLHGAVAPAEWAGLLVPGRWADASRMVYLESLFLGPPLILCGLLGAWRRKWLLAAAAGFCVLATLPEVGGGELLLALTGGLVRYPSRFALVGLAMLLPMIGVGTGPWIEGKGRWLAVSVSALGLVLCAVSSHPLRWWIAGLPAVLTLLGGAVPAWRRVRAAALAAGLVGVGVAAVPLLGLQPAGVVSEDGDTWPEAEDGGRVYAPNPSQEVMPWISSTVDARRLWPVGYLNLMDGIVLARTDSPVANRHLVKHLRMADRGPENRWWLDTLGARWVVLREASGVPAGMEEVRVRDEMRLLRNLQAVDGAQIANHPPIADERPVFIPGVEVRVLEGNSVRVEADSRDLGYLWISLAPVRGWRWRLDDNPVSLERGPGIVQYIPVAAGRHELVGRYRPPGLVPCTMLSLLAAFVMVAGPWRIRRPTSPI